MCADVQAQNQFYIICQSYVNEAICYKALEKEVEYALTPTGTKAVRILKPPYDVCHFLQPFEGCVSQWSSMKDWEPHKVIADTKAHIKVLFGEDKVYESTVFLLFIIGTYLHQMFDYFPNLWLHIPDPPTRQRAEFLSQNLCFNGHIIRDGYTFETTLSIIAEFTPTLIFHWPNEFGKGRIAILLRTRNTKSRIILTKDLQITKTYAPRLVLSDDQPATIHLGHTLLLMSDARLGDPIFDETLFATLRLNLILLARFIMVDVRANLIQLGSKLAQYDLRLMIQVLAQSLKSHNLLTDIEIGELDRGLDEAVGLSKKDYPFNYEQEIFHGLCQFLDKNEGATTDGYFSIASIVDELKLTEATESVTLQGLRRILNRYRLIKDKPQRRREKQTLHHNPWNSTVHVVQRTYVQIDATRLRRLMHYDDIIA